ncbi:glycerol-3-phosphate 1-O-acyltransferase PlsY [Synechococcus sp. PCC 7336]|uniref:glycerol-3-phosphate 1-O-acyltransferase PlsY n=1 Tax=Synechococcus sp. PCC 7336 TaxID=195250 RepID=UPI000346F539|nr:glycerol-3-phosphate 1-O-acyltransferase PlsY [Synechococcus sp. PCC 7336]
MTAAIALLLCTVIGYLLGSIPTGYWVGWVIGGIDMREQGSGSTGATNVLRTLGKGPAAIVLGVDLLKGALAVVAARAVVQTVLIPAQAERWWSWFAIAAALLAIVGHSRSIWMNFKGGKSAATSLGVLLAISWPVGLSVLGVWLGTLAIARIVSLSSMLAAGSAAIFMAVFGLDWPFIAFAIVGGLYVIWRHRSNIRRLLAGTEPRIGQKLAEEDSLSAAN